MNALRDNNIRPALQKGVPNSDLTAKTRETLGLLSDKKETVSTLVTDSSRKTTGNNSYSSINLGIAKTNTDSVDPISMFERLVEVYTHGMTQTQIPDSDFNEVIQCAPIRLKHIYLDGTIYGYFSV